MARWRRLFRDAYLAADPRSLALGRIALALVLLLDLAKRAAELGTWYTNEGLLPNHTLLWSPTYDWVVSFFYMASHLHEAALGMMVCAVAYLALLVGYRTRLAQVASFLCVLSLHGRVLFVQNGGDVVLGELCFWTTFLPTGRRYSIDSLRARLRAHPDRDAADLEPRDDLAPDRRPVVSLAALALLLQIAVIYFFNAIHKTGVTWREGSVVHYVLHQDRIVTTLGLWVRDRMTPLQGQLFSWSALVIEALLPVLFLLPFGVARARRLAVLLVVALHVGFGVFLNLGVFVPTMIAFGLHFVPGADFDALERRWARRRRRRTVVFDAGCGFCFQVVRVLARLDRAGHLRFVPNDADPLPASDLDRRLLEGTIVVLDQETGRRWLRADAFAEIATCLPLGAPVAIVLRLPIVRAVAARVYDGIARRRARISETLGLAACGIASPRRSGKGGRPPAPSGHEPGGTGRWRVRMREGLVALAVVLATSQLLVENPAVPAALRPTRPSWMEAAVVYLQLFQGWAMFAPDAPLDDMNVYVDAVTADGRHVDPFNEAANPGQPAPGPRIPPRLDQSSFFCDYLTRIEGRAAYHQAFTEWILAYPRRTGDKRDRIVSFEAFVVTDDSPRPGESQPRNVRARRFLSYPHGR